MIARCAAREVKTPIVRVLLDHARIDRLGFRVAIEVAVHVRERALGADVLVTNGAGDLLLHPDPSRTFRFETGAPLRWSDEYTRQEPDRFNGRERWLGPAGPSVVTTWTALATRAMASRKDAASGVARGGKERVSVMAIRMAEAAVGPSCRR